MLTTGLATAFVIWLMIPAGRIPAVTFGLILVAGYASMRATSAWFYWLVLVRGWLPLIGRLPWRIQDFLTDAYERGVLRQTGAVYQFRHARLHDTSSPTHRQQMAEPARRRRTKLPVHEWPP